MVKATSRTITITVSLSTLNKQQKADATRTEFRKHADLVQIDLDYLVVLAAFVWHQQVGVFIRQGGDLWEETHTRFRKLIQREFYYNETVSEVCLDSC